MPGFDAKSAHEPEPHDIVVASRNARYGLIFFAVYLIIYGGFVLLNAFAPQVMGRVAFGGLNVAVVYGLGLIVAALLLAAVYGWLCRSAGGPS